MICATCNGWGKVIAIAQPATAFSMDYRRAVFKRLIKLGQKPELPLREAVCTNCGGYGEKPRGDE